MTTTENKSLSQKEDLQSKLSKSLQVIRLYDWLINCYVLDFYVDEHWDQLPGSWRACLEQLQPAQLSELLICSEEQQSKHVWPLSLLALKQLFKQLYISRIPRQVQFPISPLLSHPKLKHLFTKCVKPKKRHEIQRMAGFCKQSCMETGVDFVLDFGAGLGHLARALGYGYGVQVCCLEMQQELNVQARVIDEQLERIAAKQLPATTLETFKRPTHVTMKLTSNTSTVELLDVIKTALNINQEQFTFGIIGLHPCGDLGAILMRMLLNCPQARFLNFVGCCYMKLSTKTEPNSNLEEIVGYPLSNYLCTQNELQTKLCYEAREISCHAAETYCDRLSRGDYEYLKVHSYRAAAERILVRNWPELRHCGLRSVKHTPGLAFRDYFYRAVKGSRAENLPPIELETLTTLNDLEQWKRVVIFYTLRLMFAPLIESIILNDRILYMLENDCIANIDAIFDPRLSPRNHISTAIKLNK